MSRLTFNLCCYGAAAICLAVGIISLIFGHGPLGVILSVGAVTFAAAYANDRRRRIILRTPKESTQTTIQPNSVTTVDGKLVMKCAKCCRDNVFDQPYAYHSGFGEQGFVYSDSGHFTLVWS